MPELFVLYPAFHAIAVFIVKFERLSDGSEMYNAKILMHKA